MFTACQTMPGLSNPDLFSTRPSGLFFTQARDQDARVGEDTIESAACGQSERSLRALVVDDTEDIALFFAFLLERAGYKVETAYSGLAALQLAREKRFSLVLSDIGMPRMDGYELARQLRQIPGYEGVPLIAVTGYAQFYEREQAIAAGYNAHLKKPVDAETLLRAITSLDES